MPGSVTGGAPEPKAVACSHCTEPAAATVRRQATGRRRVTDITCIRTHEGWLYLAVVIDLCSRQVVSWSMQPRMERDLVLNALLMALWRCKPGGKVVIHTDQGSRYTSHKWQAFLAAHNLECSMNRRGSCHDNAVADSFFQLLKRERIRRRIYTTREAARSDSFDYLEMFHNTRWRHGYNDKLSPAEYESNTLRGQGVSRRLVAIHHLNQLYVQPGGISVCPRLSNGSSQST